MTFRSPSIFDADITDKLNQGADFKYQAASGNQVKTTYSFEERGRGTFLFRVPPWTEVRSPLSGTIRKTNYGKLIGNDSPYSDENNCNPDQHSLEILCKGEKYSPNLYASLSFVSPSVIVGQRVEVGDVIGHVAGFSTDSDPVLVYEVGREIEEGVIIMYETVIEELDTLHEPEFVTFGVQGTEIRRVLREVHKDRKVEVIKKTLGTLSLAGLSGALHYADLSTIEMMSSGLSGIFLYSAWIKTKEMNYLSKVMENLDLLQHNPNLLLSIMQEISSKKE